MSRSRKKFSCYKDKSQFSRKRLNKKLRKSKDHMYKKNDGWAVSDYR